MYSWLLVTAFLATTISDTVGNSGSCSSVMVSGSIEATNDSTRLAYVCDTYTKFPIEEFCIPTVANNAESLTLDLRNCLNSSAKWIPTKLFQRNNRLKRLHIFAPPTIQLVKNGTFENLQMLEDLTLEGFDRSREIERDVFRPLVSLKKLSLFQFGSQYMKYRQLGDALQDLSNSPLQEITMDGIHGIGNSEKDLNLTDLFRISNVTISSLVFVNNDFNSVKGALSKVLPFLRYIEFRMYWLTYAAMNFGIDSFIFLNYLEDVNYSFLRDLGSVGSPPATRNNSDFDPLGGLDENISNYFSQLQYSRDCFMGRVMRISPSLKRVVVNNMDFIIRNLRSDLCVDEDNQVEYVDFFKCPFGNFRGSLKGLKKVKYLNLQETQLQDISSTIFKDIPDLEALLLGGNFISSAIENDLSGNIFRNQKLRTLDLAQCGIKFIPPLLVSKLENLQILNLSRNNVEHLEMKLDHCLNLSVLQVNDNSLRTLSKEMIDQLESLQNRSENSSGVIIDLSRNPLSCLCNNTEFITWIQTTRRVSMQNFEDYSCLHPSGIQVNIGQLNVTELIEECKILIDLNNTRTCPCNGLDFERLQRVSLSLFDIYCSVDGKRTSYAELVAKSNKTLRNYWWCENVVFQENSIYKSPKFIAAVTSVSILVIAVGVLIVVIYRKYGRPTTQDFNQMLQCMDIRPLIMHVMNRINYRPQRSHTYDVFVYFHGDDANWARRVLLPKLKPRTVITPENFVGGAAIVDAILEAIEISRCVVLVLSPSFREDNWCREVTVRVYPLNGRCLVPILIEGARLADFENDSLFSNLVFTHNPVAVGVDDELCWNEFMSRIDNASLGFQA